MRILYVVQRYGEKIVGGSEAACRHFAEQLVQRGHEVHVLTSCAHDYVDWADEYEPGVHLINGVQVHRLQVVEPRTDKQFAPLHNWITAHPGSAPLFEQQRWTTLMGPQLQDQRSWLLEHAHTYDVVVFMTYLYTTTTQGLPTVAGRVPTILQPTAHDEPPAYVSLFNSVFRQADAFLFFTPEEKQVVERLYGVQPQGATIGIGIETDKQLGDGQRFRNQFEVNDSNYLVYVGRLDAMKGVGELLRFFDTYKKRNKVDLNLVLAGGGQIEVPERDDVIVTGFLDEQMKRDVIAGSLALVQPSYFESFSIVLCEAWLESRPALVQGHGEVLRGQALRSNGAIPYEGFAEFESSVNYLLNNRDVGDQMGRKGLEYVKNNYDWNVVLQRFEETVVLAQKRFSDRRLVTTPLQ
jgi:glycosyltransferase involved in cell wall biosynthesis